MHKIKFEESDQDHWIIVEVVAADTVRMILFERDEIRGVRAAHVCDIFEIPSRVIGKWVNDQCEIHEMNLFTDVKFQVEFDLGRAVKRTGCAKKINEQAPLAYAKLWCLQKSKEYECVQHLQATTDGKEITYHVSDWYDDATVASYENGREIG
mgnify:CR=1 FL=1